ncbi:MAG: triose-phosphate isomerase [Bacteroidia bacterium]|nr:triose-phosphate isomerase [Bacteroidia bacterium]
MRKKIAAGNWKMNLTSAEAGSLAGGVLEAFAGNTKENVQVIFAPSYPYLPQIVKLAASHDRAFVSAQNLHQEESGAYTGEISASMLTSIGVTHVIIGHSERRQYFGETNAVLAAKINRALAHGLVPIYCIGETLAEREAGKTLEVNRIQLSEGAFHLDATNFGKLIVAYEPVWAIGTGKTASPAQAQEVHQYIRSLITEKYGASVAENTSILYGGSVKAANAPELFSQADIDGGLVGGASLNVADFAGIIQALG